VLPFQNGRFVSPPEEVLQGFTPGEGIRLDRGDLLCEVVPVRMSTRKETTSAA
jgi:hypothetical protein